MVMVLRRPHVATACMGIHGARGRGMYIVDRAGFKTGAPS